eukprot:5695523-Amphidinium_carterae.1
MLREIEVLSSGLWHHVTLGRSEGSVSWFLPTLKTDPQAFGCIEDWPCPMCATVSHDAVLRA